MHSGFAYRVRATGARALALLAGLAMAALALPGRAHGEEVLSAQEPRAFLSGFSGGGHLLRYLGHRDESQENRYVTAGAMEMDFEVLSWAQRFQFRTRFALTVGMGQSVADNLPFSPKETAYEINPFLECRTGGLLYRAGWVHACRHLIYKDNDEPWYLEEGVDVPPDVYFNRLYAGAGLQESRREILAATYLGPAATEKKPRLVWYAEAGGYVRSLGGLANEDSLYGDNDWAADLKADLMLPLRLRKSYALFAASRTHALFDTSANATWRERLELEIFFASRGFGSSIFAAWNAVDEHPFDSVEGLYELGARFFF